MTTFIKKTLPDNDFKRKHLAIGITLILSCVLTLWGIYGIGQYGIALFILTPLVIGAVPAILYGLKKPITRKVAFQLGLLTLGLFTLGLILFAIEGLICIAMAAPIALLLMWTGSLIGYFIVKKTPGQATASILVLLASIPAMAFVEKDNKPSLTAVATSIEIKASPQTVWRHVIEFPELDEPTEFIFKTGIAYPINATIKGVGTGAVRYCNFTTGSFVEPIKIWNEPTLLRFDVAEQPQPMKELSFWNIDAPHLHDYFVSKQGQFKLTELPNGHTLLEGTTWYYHNIQPAFYWKLWSNHIIHTIHKRVLEHIRKNSEEEPEPHAQSH